MRASKTKKRIDAINAIVLTSKNCEMIARDFYTIISMDDPDLFSCARQVNEVISKCNVLDLGYRSRWTGDYKQKVYKCLPFVNLKK